MLSLASSSPSLYPLPGAIPEPPPLPDLHVLSMPETIHGRRFVSCSCGFVVELHEGVEPFCARANAEDEYAMATEQARRTRDRHLAFIEWNQVRERLELRNALVGRSR